MSIEFIEIELEKDFIEGSTSKVYFGTWDSIRVAVKLFNVDMTQQEWLAEWNILNRAYSLIPGNIIQPLGCGSTIIDNNIQYYIVMPRKQAVTSLNPEQILTLTHVIGVLQENNIFLGDIHINNLVTDVYIT
jgi:hypothetical protein